LRKTDFDIDIRAAITYNIGVSFGCFYIKHHRAHYFYLGANT
jgi:hypothetical protein